MDALRGQQQLDGLEDVRLIVGNQHTDWLVAYWGWSASTSPALASAIEMPYSSSMEPVARFTSMRAFSYAVSAVTSADSARASSCSASSVC